MIISQEDEPKVIAWICEHHTEFRTRTELIAAAFNTILQGKPQPKVTSSSVYRLITKAGLTKSASNRKKNNTAPLDAIKEAEARIYDALLQLDAERNRLTARILDIDNIITKYKKL